MILYAASVSGLVCNAKKMQGHEFGMSQNFVAGWVGTLMPPHFTTSTSTLHRDSINWCLPLIAALPPKNITRTRIPLSTLHRWPSIRYACVTPSTEDVPPHESRSDTSITGTPGPHRRSTVRAYFQTAEHRQHRSPPRAARGFQRCRGQRPQCRPTFYRHRLRRWDGRVW